MDGIDGAQECKEDTRPGDTKAGPMSEGDRQKLCEKLNDDLEDFIMGLPRQKYTEGWPEDRWEEEMEKHPFFMTKPPKPGEPLHPLLEGLQQLKYDPDDNTAEDLASNYKADGNHNFSLKKYRFAVANYTEGLKQRCPNQSLHATLFSNRAAAHLRLGNHRSALRDCRSCLQLCPDHLKAWVCGTKCCLKLGLPDEALEWCQGGLGLDPTSQVLNDLQKEAQKLKKLVERDRRRKAKLEAEEQGLLESIRSQGIPVKDLGSLEPSRPGLTRVHFDPTSPSLLCWPVLFLYPEHAQSDIVQAFREDQTLADHLGVMFQDPPEWDPSRQYRLNRLKVYHEVTGAAGSLKEVSLQSTLRDIMSAPGYNLVDGTPTFLVLVDGSQAHLDLLSRCPHLYTLRVS